MQTGEKGKNPIKQNMAALTSLDPSVLIDSDKKLSFHYGSTPVPAISRADATCQVSARKSAHPGECINWSVGEFFLHRPLFIVNNDLRSLFVLLCSCAGSHYIVSVDIITLFVCSRMIFFLINCLLFMKWGRYMLGRFFFCFLFFEWVNGRWSSEFCWVMPRDFIECAKKGAKRWKANRKKNKNKFKNRVRWW